MVSTRFGIVGPWPWVVMLLWQGNHHRNVVVASVFNRDKIPTSVNRNHGHENERNLFQRKLHKFQQQLIPKVSPADDKDTSSTLVGMEDDGSIAKPNDLANKRFSKQDLTDIGILDDASSSSQQDLAVETNARPRKSSGAKRYRHLRTT